MRNHVPNRRAPWPQARGAPGGGEDPDPAEHVEEDRLYRTAGGF